MDEINSSKSFNFVGESNKYEHMYIIIVIALLLLVFFIVNQSKRKYPPPREDLKAYHFGFPTHGSYSYGGGPLKTGAVYGGYGYPGYGGYGYGYPHPYRTKYYWGMPPYLRYRNYIKPYLTGSCYSSSKDEDCRVNYSKTKKDSDGDGVPDEWLCCRDEDMF